MIELLLCVNLGLSVVTLILSLDALATANRANERSKEAAATAQQAKFIAGGEL